MHKSRIKDLEQAVIVAVALSRGGQSRGGAMFRTWMRLTNDAMLLGFETQRVIGLRLVKLSRGGPDSRIRGAAHGQSGGGRHAISPFQRIEVDSNSLKSLS